MLVYSFAPSSASPPALWARYTWVEGLHLTWDDVGGIDSEDIVTLVRMHGIYSEAQSIRGRTAGVSGGAPPLP